MNNIVPIIIAVVAMHIIGFIWYGPLFGKQWMRVIGKDPANKEEMDRAKKGMGITYALNILFTVMQCVALAIVIGAFEVINAPQGMWIAVLMWLGFVIPYEGAMAIFGGKPRPLSIKMFFIGIGYRLLALLAAGMIIGGWQ